MELARQVRAGEVDAGALVAVAEARIEASSLHAVVARARVEGATTGPFAGVPTLVKDLLPFPGVPITMGCRLFQQHVPAEPLPYVDALLRSGLTVVGVSASSELGLLGSTETTLHGVTRSPWGPDLSAGGSSGGAAAAVAAGLVPIAHASDGGGSIRLPAALNGLVGFKASAGASAVATPTPNPMSDLVSEGCVSWSVRDTDAYLAATAAVPRAPYGPAELPSLRVGVYLRDAFGREAAPEGRAAVEEAATLLASLGHRVVFDDGPELDGAAVSDAFFTCAGSVLSGLEQMMAPVLGRSLRVGDVEPFTLALLRRFQACPPTALGHALGQVQAQGAALRAYLDRFDVVVCPTVGGPRPRLGHLAPHLPMDVLLARTEVLAGFTAAYNMAGAPAVSLPLHVDSDGLPVGVQLAAPPGADPRLMALAYQLESSAPWLRPR
jgi:amidase